MRRGLLVALLSLAFAAPAMAQTGSEEGVAPAEDPPPSPAVAEAEPEEEEAPPPPETSQPSQAPQPAPQEEPAPAPRYQTSYGNEGDLPEADDDEDDEDDDHDPYDFLWIQLHGVVSYVNMRALGETNFYPQIVQLSGVGGGGEAAVGFRIEFLSVGVRGHLSHIRDGLEVGTAVAEAQLSIPIPIVKPFIRAGFGFGWHGDADAEGSIMSTTFPNDVQTTVFGWAFEAAAGLDIYLANWFSIGAAFVFDILNMSRQSWDEEPGGVTEVEFTDPGDAVGILVRGTAGITFHL